MLEKIELDVPEIVYVLQEKLSEAGYLEPLPNGGYFRDLYRKKAFADLDIKLAAPVASTGTNLNEIITKAEELMRKIPEMLITDARLITGGSYDYGTPEGPKKLLRLSGIFNHAGEQIETDLIVTDQAPEINQLVGSADAPINAIAMDMNGDVWAHPFFEDDIKDGYYAILRTDKKPIFQSIKRFESLRERFEGLKLFLDPEIMGRQGFSHAVQYCQNEGIAFMKP